MTRVAERYREGMTEPRTGADELRHLHPPDEGDPEQLAGEEIADPWDDPEQTDWPNETVVELPAGEEGGG